VTSGVQQFAANPGRRGGGRALAVWLAGVVLAAGLRGEVGWEAQKIRLDPPAGARDARGEFVFVNRGREPVRVLEARSSCECTVLARTETVVHPGQSGRVPVVVHLEGRRGRQTIGVVVVTSGPEVRQHELTVDVEIKEFAALAPRVVYWKVGDDPTPKALVLTLVDGFRLVAAESSLPHFTVTVVPRTEAVAELRVTPRDTWSRRSGELRVKVAQEGQPAVEIVAQVRVL
jgi:hypothetical protein